MEAVAAASSIVGLIAVAGSVMDGVIKLNGLVQDMQDMDERAKTLGEEVRLFTQSLEHSETALKESQNCLSELKEQISRYSAEQLTQSFKMHQKTQSQMSEVSDSLNSIASSLDQLQRSPLPPFLRKRASSDSIFSEMRKELLNRLEIPSIKSDSLRGDYPVDSEPRVWTCGAFIGIDDFLIENFDQSRVRCFFCAVDFEEDDLAGQASHMLEQHEIASCDQGAVYTFSGFEEHLIRHHSARRAVLPQLLAFGYLSRFTEPAYQISDARIKPFSGTPETTDLQMPGAFLESQMASILSRSPYFQPKQPWDIRSRKESRESRSKTFERLNLAMADLAKHVLLSPTPSTEMVDLLFQAANKEEEMIVDCNRSFSERWAPIPECLLQKTWPDLQVADDTTRTQQWTELDPELRITSLFYRLKDWTSWAEWMDLWMRGVLHKSNQLLAVFRYTAFASGDRGSILAPSEREVKKTDGETEESQFWGRMWVPDLLDAFDISVQNIQWSGTSGDLTVSLHFSTTAMEAFGAAASVAGLLSLSGQILGGLFKLGQHIQDVRELGDRTETVGKETELLVKTVTELEAILRRLEGGEIIAKHPNMTPGVSVLQHQLEQCGNDLKPWIETHLQATEPRSKRRKVASALLNSSIRAIEKLESKLASHRAQIGLGVSALNTSLSYLGLEKLESVRHDVLRLSDSTLQFNQQSAELSLKSTEESNVMHEMLMGHISALSEAQMQQSLKIQEETLSHISRLSDSLSSIASFAGSMSMGQGKWHSHQPPSETKDDIPPPPYLLKNRKRRHSSTDELHPDESFFHKRQAKKGWSCGEILGIDEAFVKSSQATVHCLFCGEEFREIDSHLQAQHIVARHNFSDCDQGAVLGSLAKFETHLRVVHSASQAALTNHRHQLTGLFRDYSTINRDTRIAVFSASPPEPEPSASLMLLSHQLQTLLLATQYLEDCEHRQNRGISSLSRNTRASEELKMFGRMGLAMQRLSRDVFSDSSATAELAGVLHRAAILEEEAVVKLNQRFLRRWAAIPACLLSTTPGNICMTENRKRRGDESRNSHLRPLLHPSRWFFDLSVLSDAPGLKFGLQPEPKDFGLGRVYEGWFQLERGLRVSALASALRNWTTTRERVNLWMLEVLHKSDHLLAMLRCSAFLGPGEGQCQETSGRRERQPTIRPAASRNFGVASGRQTCWVFLREI
ncbi:hypothetical protein CPLU01_05813 [Colletotrichum plurivorum]|uniref:Fungal N-terminal domain-containing protein n=1 Tax=Colletotrichum plurivorum TaxID=2175906 RepID=A0A8H6KK53_9PEZI|nr:hypothetical protein CPLU01_05813 [Colletotrichum plurivorum]